MAKKIIAITEIRHNDEVFAPGDTLDVSRFDKKQLESLYDAGAVRVEDLDDEKPTSIPTKSTPAPVAKEPTNGKSSNK